MRDFTMSQFAGKTRLAYARVWHHVDLAPGVGPPRPLGRLASRIAFTLMGKNKPIYDPSTDCGDYVVVTNCHYLHTTGRKREKEKYYTHTTRPGSLKSITMERLMEKWGGGEVLKRAVSGMLPKNRLREPRLARLKCFEGPQHPYEKNIVKLGEGGGAKSILRNGERHTDELDARGRRGINAPDGQMTPTSRVDGPDDGLAPPPRLVGKDGRSLLAPSFATARYAQSYRPSLAPSNSMADDKSVASRNELTRTETKASLGGDGEEGASEPVDSEQRQAEFRDRIQKEMKIKTGTENLLKALDSKNAKQAREQRKAVELELNTSKRKIVELKQGLEAEIARSREQVSSSPRKSISHLFGGMPLKSPMHPPGDAQTQPTEAKSASFVFAEILQALEVEDKPSDYYVRHANHLVELLKLYGRLKYDLAWSLFGQRMQMLLLSDCGEVVAAGYRVIRYAMSGRSSLQTIRKLQTDYFVILSLVQESRRGVDREQAMKFVRAFLDIPDGVLEIDPGVARAIVAVASNHDEHLRNIAILTLAELLVKAPMLVIQAGGLSVLSYAMGSGVYAAPETLIDPFLHLMDPPNHRRLLQSGFEFSTAFASLTEPFISHMFEDRLQSSARVISALFKSWPGLMTLALHDFLPVRSVVAALYVTSMPVRSTVLDLLAEILRIKMPSWSAPFIGGRRLTTYGRVTNLNSNVEQQTKAVADESDKRSLVQHFLAVSLTILLRQGLLTALVLAERDAPTQPLRRKTGLLLAEVLCMASELLPPSWSSGVQSLPELFDSATNFHSQGHFHAVSTVYQVDSINRTLQRSLAESGQAGSASSARTRAASRAQTTVMTDETSFRSKVVETGVLQTVNFTKWDWKLIQELIDGPMSNPKRLQEAMATTKLVHRLLGFLRPFKGRFSNEPNNKVNQRYVRMATSLLKLLLQTNEGAKYLEANKLIPQIGECLAQQDPMSGITSKSPLFSPEQLQDKLVGGYLDMLGVMCSDHRGIQLLERWKIINICYHIVELKQRDDLIRLLIKKLDYTLYHHPRIILSKTMVRGSKQMRILCTKMLRKYAMMPIEAEGGAEEPATWAIKLLVDQLYDPDVEVCEVAIKILEEACNNLTSLEYVVKCRPALDHLGAIGAPLLLRFLSTSVGYFYLDGLDYITKEMDDWFLGRNETYVMIVEASLARALAEPADGQNTPAEDGFGPADFGCVPPHFYRELTRTAEGCELLKAKGHFEEFSATIADFGMEESDVETILKVKGCLWAVGNVGSMERGAFFLEQTDVVGHIVKIAEQSQVMSLRGTAFFVLGLISRSLHGQEILMTHGWDGAIDDMGRSLGYVLPLDFDKLLALHPTQPAPFPSRGSPVEDDDPVKTAILRLIVKMPNSVLANKASMDLQGFKARHAACFEDVDLFRKVMDVLSLHSYRMPQYRFIVGLFDDKIAMMREIIADSGISESSDDD
ncbi:hypothetical protein K470DRAFT_276999 [Piedraia hortae CBS 480.64]|uniref:Large ribosomal subunit protein uL13m n=1 Tax=Piedraia hortae CBS 480.64 TaxID=1314780 RepID=A0A6A7BYT5_9PEZI|nr:hypothetical protein K470DRAFT_276999 [Piedraia hortae CBS 480.64]